MMNQYVNLKECDQILRVHVLGLQTNYLFQEILPKKKKKKEILPNSHPSLPSLHILSYYSGSFQNGNEISLQLPIFSSYLFKIERPCLFVCAPRSSIVTDTEILKVYHN